jgi:hypothetical protein
MNDLLDILDKLQDTDATIARLREDLAAYPNIATLRLEAESLQKRRGHLEAQLLAISEDQGIDICNYRFLPEKARPKLAGLAGALLHYQTLVTLFYDAIKNGPKAKARISAETVEQTAFEFAYAYVGSIGFMLTIPNDRLMLIESDLDASIHTVFEVAKAQKPEEILAYALRYGRGPIKTLYDWASDHVRSGLSADIEWRRGKLTREKVSIQKPEFENLQRTILMTSEEQHEEIVIEGTLVGADIVGRSFHLRPDHGDDISGRAITLGGSVLLGTRYRATIRKTVQIVYATEEEKTSYELLDLLPLSAAALSQ